MIIPVANVRTQRMRFTKNVGGMSAYTNAIIAETGSTKRKPPSAHSNPESQPSLIPSMKPRAAIARPAANCMLRKYRRKAAPREFRSFIEDASLAQYPPSERIFCQRLASRSNRHLSSHSKGRLMSQSTPTMSQKPSQIAISAKIMLRMVPIIKGSLSQRYRCMSTVAAMRGA